MSDKMRRNEKRIIRVTLFLIGLGAAVFFILRDSLNNLWYVFFLGVLVVKIFPLIFFGNREERVLRYFRRKSNVRIQLVEEIVNKADPVDELLEPMEVVAVFSTLIAKHGVSHAVHLMTNLSHRGWDNYFNEDFFDLILPTSRELRWVGLKND